MLSEWALASPPVAPEEQRRRYVYELVVHCSVWESRASWERLQQLARESNQRVLRQMVAIRDAMAAESAHGRYVVRDLASIPGSNHLNIAVASEIMRCGLSGAGLAQGRRGLDRSVGPAICACRFCEHGCAAM